jgi:alpha,alpha-trehalase
MTPSVTEAFLLTFFRFGWVNASYIYGLTLLSAHQRRALGALTDYDSYEKAISDLGMA